MKKPTIVLPIADPGEQQFTIRPPDFRVLELEIIGTAPLMMNRFSQKMREKMLADHVAGSAQKGKVKGKPAKDVNELFNNARYVSHEGWDGILCASLRNALIRTCSIVGFKMTSGKQSIFILPDGFDAKEGVPLVRIHGDVVQHKATTNPTPILDDRIVRNANGQPDVRIRPRWDAWRLVVRVKYDADVFQAQDVVNLMSRAGVQNGLGEGRPFSKNGNGIDFGTFRIAEAADAAQRPREIAA